VQREVGTSDHAPVLATLQTAPNFFGPAFDVPPSTPE
jgi:hypothetical protein